MDTRTAINERHSVRAFQPDRPIPREVLTQIVEAGRLAPTARNEQPWEFVVVTERDLLQQLGGFADHGRFIADASACIAVICQATKYYIEDGSAATTQMLLAATDLGIAGCWVAGDKKDYAPQAVHLLGAPPELRLVALIALGYAANVKHAPKRALTDVLHWNHFGRFGD